MVQGENGCQLYLILPPEQNTGNVSEFVEAGDFTSFACALLQSRSDGAVDRVYAGTLLHRAHAENIPLLLQNDISAASELGADGVHIPSDEALYAQARKTLGDDAIIGVECGQSRHAGLSFAELGADYIAFERQPAAAPGEEAEQYGELIAWWAETVTVPCVAWDMESMESARRMAGAGADFVAINEPVWSHPKGAVLGASDLRASFEKQQAPA